MRKTFMTLVSTVLFIGLAALGTALRAAKPAADVPLLITFGHTETDALTSDGFTAPGFAADYVDGVENVLALIQPSGNLRYSTQKDTRKPAIRGMCIDFGSQFDDRGMSVPFVDGQARQCTNVLQPMHGYAEGDVSIASLRYGQSVAKLTRFGWDDGEYRYRLGYGTDMNIDGMIDSPSVSVTCIAPPETTAACTTWVLAPTTDGAAALFRFKLLTKKGQPQEGPAEFIGVFTMPFVQTLARK